MPDLPGAPTSVGASRPLVLEREHQLDSLDELIGKAGAGQGGLALVEGPAGIGKTLLLSLARARGIAAGLRVLSARGGELEREFPFGVVRQLFEPAVAGECGGVLVGSALAARAVLGAVEDRPLGATEVDPSFASLHGLYWLTVNLCARSPLLFVIDDLHWCDRASLRFLMYLIRRLEGLPLLVLASLRPADPGMEAAVMGQIVSEPTASRLHPRALSETAVAYLVRARLGRGAADEFTAACHRATGGNPLLLHELLETLQAEGVKPDRAHLRVVAELGPRAVSRAVLLRLSRVSESSKALAQAAAVLGDGSDLPTVAALSGLEERRAGWAAAELSRADILRPGTPLEFVHPLVGAAVHHDIAPGERGLRHQQAAWLLWRRRGPVERVAAHLFASPAHGQAWVIQSLLKAADVARQRGAADSAVAYLTRALAEPPASELLREVLLALGQAELLTHGPGAVEHLGEVYDMLDGCRERAVTAQALARALLFTGRPAAAAVVARQAAAQLPADESDLKKALQAVELFAVLFGAGEPELLRRLESERARPESSGVGAKMLAAIAAQEWAYMGGESAACAELAMAALSGGELIAVDNGLLATCAIVVLVLADRREAEEAWELARRDAHERGSLLATSSMSLWWGFTQYWWGELAEAEESLRAALSEFELWGYGSEQARIYGDAFLASVLLERGDVAGARRALDHSRDPGGRDDGARFWLNSRLEILLAEDRAEEVLAAADDYAGRFDRLRPNSIDGPWRSHKAAALARLGRMVEALELAEQELALARQWGAPGPLSRALRRLGVLEGDQGLDHLREAVEVAGRSPARLEQAKAHGALGAALRRARRPKEARGPLRHAVDLAEVCGARHLSEGLRAELSAAGGRPRTTALSGIGSLTPSERRVAELAAQGKGNRDVAQILFVTPKTVEIHLSNTYRKLGIRSRQELAAALDVTRAPWVRTRSSRPDLTRGPRSSPAVPHPARLRD